MHQLSIYQFFGVNMKQDFVDFGEVYIAFGGRKEGTSVFFSFFAFDEVKVCPPDEHGSIVDASVHASLCGAF